MAPVRVQVSICVVIIVYKSLQILTSFTLRDSNLPNLYLDDLQVVKCPRTGGNSVTLLPFVILRAVFNTLL
jgi:hypothetical protein